MASKLLWASRAASYLRISVFHRGFATGIISRQLHYFFFFFLRRSVTFTFTYLCFSFMDVNLY